MGYATDRISVRQCKACKKKWRCAAVRMRYHYETECPERKKQQAVEFHDRTGLYNPTLESSIIVPTMRVRRK